MSIMSDEIRPNVGSNFVIRPHSHEWSTTPAPAFRAGDPGRADRHPPAELTSPGDLSRIDFANGVRRRLLTCSPMHTSTLIDYPRQHI